MAEYINEKGLDLVLQKVSEKIIAYESILQQLNPEYAEKQKQEAEIINLKNQVAAMAQSNANLEQMMTQLLSEIKGDKNTKN